MADESSSYDRLKDVLVHAPIGFALYARDTAPGFLRLFVTRGREELERQKRHVDETVQQARSVGRVVVEHGPPVVRRRVEGGVDRARGVASGVMSGLARTDEHDAGTEDGVAATPTAEPGSTEQVSSEHVSWEPGSSAPSDPAVPAPPHGADGPSDPARSAPLPIPDYDELAASQVVERLAGLDRVELDAIAAYERARRGRRTILGKIEQLTA